MHKEKAEQDICGRGGNDCTFELRALIWFLSPDSYTVRLKIATKQKKIKSASLLFYEKG